MVISFQYMSNRLLTARSVGVTVENRIEFGK
jgi:hypothetical protein